ncbi:MAG TPA: glycosyltransferase family 4 protein [Tepidisphaeraceae bacterium]|nr:glycosyltransferase family 4 protein [Tepidisphaeraceae bacterium]
MGLVTSTTRPTLAVICNSLPPYRVHVQERLARELDVNLFSLVTHEGTDRRWKFNPPPGINPVSFGLDRAGCGHWFNLAAYRKGGEVIEWLRANRADCVVIFGYSDATRVRVIRWCHRNGVPCFVWGDSNILGDRATGAKAAAKEWFVSTVLSWCTGALACGQRGVAYFEKYGVPRERIFLFPNEPDYELIRRVSDESLDAVKQRYRLARGRRRMIYSGRLTQVKRVDLLIDAFAAVANERSEWDLIIAGDGELKLSLQARVPADLKDRIIWTGFLDDQQALSAFYRLSDVLVLPSDFEPWALVINEAAAAGLAIVSSSVVGAVPELVQDGVNGRLFEPGDLESLKRALLDTTMSGKLEQYKSASSIVLENWRKVSDPVNGLKQALKFASRNSATQAARPPAPSKVVSEV